MSRLVTARAPGARAFSSGKPGGRASDYAERVAKYVPAEIVAAYLALLPIVNAATEDGDDLRTVLLAIVLGGCVILVPIYLSKVAEPGKPKRLHLIVATIAMVVWAYSIGGFFTDIGWYHEAVAAVAITFYSLISGLLIPTTGTA